MRSRFCRYELRTTDVQAARRFYSDVIGLVEDDVLAVVPLPERARARGAPAHWLGHVGVDDVDATLARMRALGCEPLGPTSVRDPGGAVVAVCPHVDGRAPVAWHQLHTVDRDRVFATYASLFAWKEARTSGDHLLFAWDERVTPIGSVASTARLPGIHPHWLFYFAVDDLDGALARVDALGGHRSQEAATLGNGDRIAPCEDAEGAAFGLLQPRLG